MYRGREYLMRAAHLSHQHDLRIVSLAAGLQRHSNRTITLRNDEVIGTMCQLLYMDIAQDLLFDETRMIFSERLYMELERVPVSYSLLTFDLL